MASSLNTRGTDMMGTGITGPRKVVSVFIYEREKREEKKAIIECIVLKKLQVNITALPFSGIEHTSTKSLATIFAMFHKRTRDSVGI